MYVCIYTYASLSVSLSLSTHISRLVRKEIDSVLHKELQVFSPPSLALKQAILNTSVLKFFKIWLVVLRNALNILEHSRSSNPLDALCRCGRTGDFYSRERAARIVFPTEASSPIPEISTSQGAEDSTHCSALLQGTAPAEEMDPLIQDK